MGENDQAIAVTPSSRSTATRRVASFFGYSVVAVVYAAIFAATLLTLGLILVRQANVDKFNYLIATLDERDRIKKAMPDALERLQHNEKTYNEKLNDITTCLSGPMRYLQGTNRATGSRSSAATASVTCDDLEKIRNNAAELKKNEFEIIFK